MAPPPMTTPTNRGNDQSWKAITLNQRAEAGRGKEQPKTAKKGDTSGKDKAMDILMIQPWQKVARQRITQSFTSDLEISFPSLGEEDRTEGHMIIEAEIGSHFIHRMYVDRGPHIGFSGEIIWPMGQILLLVKIGDAEHLTSTWMNFVVVRSPSPYNEIIGRLGVRKIQAVPSTAHGMLKFPVPGGVLTLRSNRIIPLECTMVSGPEAQPSDVIQAAEERIKVAIHPEYPEQTIAIDMIGVPRHLAEHHLNVREGCSPVRQKERSQAQERNKGILEEVGKLVDAGIMKEVHYHNWLRLSAIGNRLEGGIPLRIPFQVLSRCIQRLSPDKKAKEDEEKTTFIASQGIFCYSKMPFGLKNARATYQRLVDKAFQKQIGKNLEVYVDDLVIKSHTDHERIRDIDETFKTLKEINLKINPKKCTFGIEEGMFLGYKVNTKGIKQLIAELPTLTAPTEKDELIVYLAAAKEAVSAVLMTEREAKQMPIYFVSRVLQGPEVNYTLMEKLVLALVHASKRLKRYFQTHTINYRPRTSAKGQILADFIVECPEDDPLDTPMEAKEELSDPWTLFTDGSSCIDGSGADLILINPKGAEFSYALRFRFDATNNEAEYEALIASLRIAEQMGIISIQANVDSRLVANQVNGSYIAKEPDMIQYLEKVKTLAGNFKKFSIKQVPRSKNKKADALSKIASTSFAHLTKQVLVEELNKKSINEVEVLAIVEEEGNTWMTPIYNYLMEETLPAEKKKARVIRHKSGRYSVINGILYKKSYLGPWLRCVGPLQANYVLKEIHEGSCNMHAGTRSVVEKAIRTGYYWPTMHADARKMIRECQDCQWGINIAGPFPEGPSKVKFLIVAIDYFTKWIEAKPVATITGNQIKNFMWDNIVCRFGLPGVIISDNEKQFRDNPFKDWCEKLCIRQCFASVKHPQANNLVERANRSLGEGIKARLDERSNDWIEEIPHVLWAHHTMIKSSNGDTPFSLTYGTEAVIPAEIGMPTLRTAEVDMVQKDENLEINLDLLEERREQAAIREARSKAKMEKYYNSKVRGTSFKPRDLVYRNNNANHAKDSGKLSPKWEGPYEVTEALGNGAYKLRDHNGKHLPRTWNVRNLKKCYMHEM
ncbi:reverse transcriptase domain-containing protein [Tanacetum coccineum]